MVVLFIHVDGSTIAGSSLTLIKVFMKQIAEHFKIINLGTILWLLGLAIIRNQNKRTLSISQDSYIESLLCHFNLENVKTLTVPINVDVWLTSEDCPSTAKGKLDMKDVPF